MEEEKHASKNTTLSYQRDLLKMADYLEENGITDCGKVTKTALNSYILFLEKEGKAASTVSRALASTRSFFGWLFKEGKIRRDPADSMHAPKIEKKVPVILTVDEVTKLLEQPSGANPKEIRDKAMLELLYATGIRVTELVNLKLSDVNMSIGFITCRDEHKERMIPFGHAAKDALAKYLESARETFFKRNTIGTAVYKLQRQSHESSGILEDYQILRGAGRNRGRHHTPHSAPFFRGAPLKQWR